MAQLLYKKLLRIKQNQLSLNAINLFSSDIYKIEFAIGWMMFLVGAPIVGIAVTIVLYLQIGVAAFVGVGCMFLNVPLQILFSRKLTTVKKEILKYTDERVRKIKEILVGAQIIKMYNW